MQRFWHSPDRLLLTLVLAIIAHAVVILGVNFALPKAERMRSSLEITLVRSFTRDAPQQADFLAQENQLGGGERNETAVPRSEPALPSGAGRELEPAPNQTRMTEVKPKEVLRQEQSEKTVAAYQGESDEPLSDAPRVSADAMPQPVTEISAVVNHSEDDSARKLRRMDINEASARKYGAAEYEHDWQDRIERVGTLHFPDEARRKGLSGSLLMTVAVRSDGSIESVDVLQSSGQPVLDDAARNIVRLAGPYAAFPAELAHQTDVLVITRTWKFFTDQRLKTSR
ncbi:MAG: energy transducer TonB [Desulfuromonas sp.]|nr:energy transducer TonB [Desulfuromonas sp.]